MARVKDYLGAANNVFAAFAAGDNPYVTKAIDNTKNRYAQGGVKAALTPQRAYAAPAQSTNPDYQWADNGSGGINYFKNGQPITNTEYQAGTGIDTNQLEAAHLAEWQATQGSSVSNSSTSGTGSSGTIQSNKVVGPDGGIYDLATPAGAAAYKVAKDNWVMDQYGKYTSEFATNLKRSKEDNSTQKLALARSKKNFYGDIAQGGTDEGSYARDIKSLATNRDAAQQSVMGRFLNLGPNVYQSAEGENLNEVGNIYNQGMTQASNEKADVEANFGTSQTAVDRVAEDLAKQEVEQPKYFENWKTQNLAQNTVDTENAQNAIKSAAAKAQASTPTFQEKTLSFLGSAAEKFNPYLNKNVYNSVVAPNLAKSAGVNVAAGTDLYNDAKILADPTSYTQDQVDNIYRKYGLLN